MYEVYLNTINDSRSMLYVSEKGSVSFYSPFEFSIEQCSKPDDVNTLFNNLIFSFIVI